MRQWLYDHRDSVSWTWALALGMAVLALNASWSSVRHEVTATEMLATLESPEIVEPPLERQAAPAQKPVPNETHAPLPMQMPVVSANPVEHTSPAPSPVVSMAPVSTATTAPTASAPPAPSQPEPLQEKRSTAAAVTISYESRLLAYLERIKRYPTHREARLSKPQGIVKLWMIISRRGELLDAGIATSSGHNLLDSEALRTVRAGTFPPFPEEAYAGEPQHRFMVSMKYEIES